MPLLTFRIKTGIAIGTVLTSGANADNLQVPNIILQGLATGTLLYVIFFEVLSKDRSGLVPYFSVCCGFLLMFFLQYIGKLFFLIRCERESEDENCTKRPEKLSQLLLLLFWRSAAFSNKASANRSLNPRR